MSKHNINHSILADLPLSTRSFCSAGRPASQVCLLTLGKGLAIPDLALAILGDADSIHVDKPSCVFDTPIHVKSVLHSHVSFDPKWPSSDTYHAALFFAVEIGCLAGAANDDNVALVSQSFYLAINLLLAERDRLLNELAFRRKVHSLKRCQQCLIRQGLKGRGYVRCRYIAPSHPRDGRE